MMFALDHDKTYTINPAMWNDCMALWRAAGHEVVCVTMRRPTEPIEMPCEVIYTSRQAKGPFMQSLGRKPDVWIDDSPHWIYTDG